MTAMKTTIDRIKNVFFKSLTALEQTRPDMDINDAQYIVFDTELTGLDFKRDSIVSIGAFKMKGGRIDLGNSYYRMVSPRTTMKNESVCIHGITPGEANNCPDIDVLLPEFLDFCGNRILVGYFVSIDTGFINNEMKRLYGSVLQNAALDIMTLHRKVGKSCVNQCAYSDKNHEDTSLLGLAANYGIPAGNAHNALEDAFMTAQVFQHMLALARQRGIQTVRELLKVGIPV